MTAEVRPPPADLVGDGAAAVSDHDFQIGKSVPVINVGPAAILGLSHDSPPRWPMLPATSTTPLGRRHSAWAVSDGRLPGSPDLPKQEPLGPADSNDIMRSKVAVQIFPFEPRPSHQPNSDVQSTAYVASAHSLGHTNYGSGRRGVRTNAPTLQLFTVRPTR